MLPSNRRSALAVFACTLAVYLSSKVMVQTDSIWSVPSAASLWLRGDLDLDEFRGTVEKTGRYGIVERHGHIYNFFPVGATLVAFPFVALTDLGLRAVQQVAPERLHRWRGAREWLEQLHTLDTIDYGRFASTERFVASLVTALGILFVFLTARREATLVGALLVAGVTAFGTPAYSTASRVLWQHGPSLLALAIIVYLLSRPRPSRAWAVGLGAIVAAAYVLRPTHAVTVVLVSGWFLLKARGQLGWYLLGALAVAVPFCALNLSLYESLLPPYYLPERLDPGENHFWEALAGNLISPSRGLFVFSPIALVSVGNAARRAFQGRLRSPEMVFAVGVPLHWLVISSFPHWWAGHSVGPRFFTDVVPYLAYFLIEPLDGLVTGFAQHRARSAGIALAALVSVAIHTRGATSFKVHAWNDGPPNVDAAPSRLWSWRDAQFRR